jgi:Peptidase_C39 like family
MASAHIERDKSSGDVWLADVPMVDQGQKGYCAVASAERVLRYYGTDTDANELAQIANTATVGGTDPDTMFGAVKKVASRLKVRVRDLEKADVRDYLRLQSEYNRAAKKAGAPEIPDMGNMIDVGFMYESMKSDLLHEVKTRNKADIAKFERGVQAKIDAGIPLLWGVQLGLFPEPGIPQSGGGHMRLIIGYNVKTQEIIFSDSWGAGHERKRMPLAQALTITTGLMTIEPL